MSAYSNANIFDKFLLTYDLLYKLSFKTIVNGNVAKLIKVCYLILRKGIFLFAHEDLAAGEELSLCWGGSRYVIDPVSCYLIRSRTCAMEQLETFIAHDLNIFKIIL